MSDSRTPDGCKTDGTSAKVKGTSWDGHPGGKSCSGKAPEVPGLLAQIPDVGARRQGPQAEAGPANGDGRILSPGVSAKILLGGGLFLLLVALMPFVFGRKDDPKPSSKDESARPRLDSPVPLASAPTWDGNNAQAPGQEPREAAGSRADNDPMVSNRTPNVHTETSPPMAQRPVAGQSGPAPTPPSEQDPRSIGPDGRYAGQRVPAQVFPPPYRYPSTENSLEYDAPGRAAPIQTNRPMALTDRAAPPVGYGDDGVRRDYRAYRDTRYAPEVADVRQAAGPRHPAASPFGAKEPGVARFKGIIEKPSVRTTYDGAGSSIY